ncbi:MAG: DUF3429 domain-containing protein [Pseudomonadota bacterium]
MIKVRSDVDTDRLQQASAYALGLGGVLPFWTIPFVGAYAAWWGEDIAATIAQWGLFYAAIIVSFMSGGRWAFRVLEVDMRPTSVFGGFLGAVAPALIAWVLIGLPPTLGDTEIGNGLRFFLMGALLIIQLTQDDDQARIGPAIPQWYMRLRGLLVLGAATPLMLPQALGFIRTLVLGDPA